MAKLLTRVQVIRKIEKMRIDLDGLIKSVEFKDPAWQPLVNAKDQLGIASLRLNNSTTNHQS